MSENNRVPAAITAWTPKKTDLAMKQLSSQPSNYFWSLK